MYVLSPFIPYQKVVLLSSFGTRELSCYRLIVYVNCNSAKKYRFRHFMIAFSCSRKITV